MDLLNFYDRKQFLQDCKAEENKCRKLKSLEAYEVYNDRITEYVKCYLQSQYSIKTALEMPIISSVNLCKRIATKEAGIYKEPPTRSFTNLTEDQEKELLALYDNAKINSKLFKSNVYFKIQQQSFLKVMPKNGSIDVKCILPHQLDVVPSSSDPESAEAYVINSFDKSTYIPSDSINQKTADKDDYKSTLERYIAWTKGSNFVFDGSGKTVGEVLPNPIEMLPFIDVSGDKDYEFFVRAGQILVDFTIQFNAALSDLAQVVKMQGWAQAYLKATKDVMPTSINVGPTKVLHLIIDENIQGTQNTEFGYASPGADVAGSIQHVENLLSTFLTSLGLDPNIVNGKAQASKYTSGLDRLLGMIEQMESSKQDFVVFENVEYELFELIKRWSDVTFGTEQQFLSFKVPETAELNIQFYQPQMVMSESEKLANIQKRIDMGIMSKQMAAEEYYNLTPDAAIELIQKVEEQDQGMINDTQANDIQGQG